MRGSIVKRQGKGRKRGKPVDLYYAVYQVGKRQKWEAVPEPRTRKHAEELLAERLQELHAGSYVPMKDGTFEDLVEQEGTLVEFDVGVPSLRQGENVVEIHLRTNNSRQSVVIERVEITVTYRTGH